MSETKVYSIHFEAYHGDTPKTCNSPLPDTNVLAQIHAVPEEPEAIQNAIEQCIRIVKSKNRRGKYFQIKKFVTTYESVKTFSKNW